LIPYSGHSIGNRFALDAEKFFQAGNGVISREQRAADRFQGGFAMVPVTELLVPFLAFFVSVGTGAGASGVLSS
jgi:hypothetical protein